MTDQISSTEGSNEMWATVELMGHAQTAGRISRPSDWGGLLRVDVPLGDGYRTEFFGMQVIYSIRLVSEEIARAWVTHSRQVVAYDTYDTPIVTREQHESVVNRLVRQARDLQEMVDVLERQDDDED